MPDFRPSRITGDIDANISGTVPVVVEGISVITYNTNGAVTNVADNVKTTILTQAYVATTFENLVMVSVSGTDYAKYFLTLNTVDIDIRRSGPDRNLQFDFTGAPLALSPGDVLDILDFEATIYGYEG